LFLLSYPGCELRFIVCDYRFVLAPGRQPAPSRRVTLPRRPDYRRAVTGVKDACGAGEPAGLKPGP